MIQRLRLKINVIMFSFLHHFIQKTHRMSTLDNFSCYINLNEFIII